jgi:hypothetical protein
MLLGISFFDSVYVDSCQILHTYCVQEAAYVELCSLNGAIASNNCFSLGEDYFVFLSFTCLILY